MESIRLILNVQNKGIFLFTLFVGLFGANTTTLLAATEPAPFVASEVLSASKLNNNFKVVYGSQTHGANYIPNTSLELNNSGWIIDQAQSTGVMTRVNVEGPAGKFALQNDAGAVVSGSSDTWFSVDQNKSYYVTATFRAIAGAGAVSLVVRLQDQNNNEIKNGIDGWFLPANKLSLPLNQWTYFKAEFGAGTTQPFPAAAKFATVAFILNSDSATGGTAGSIFQVQGLGIYDGGKGPESNWQNLVLAQGITPFGQEYQIPQFRKIDDIVCLRGLANGVPVNGDNILIANLPAGYSPPARIIYTTAGSITGAIITTTTGDRVDITAAGEIIANRNDEISWVTLDGICYSTTP